MRSVTASQLRAQLRKYLKLARAGEEITIYQRQRPAARLIPFSACDATEEELSLVAAGIMRLPKKPLDVDELLRIPTGRVSGNEAVEALLEEREAD